jgi:hypothetical protein
MVTIWRTREVMQGTVGTGEGVILIELNWTENCVDLSTIVNETRNHEEKLDLTTFFKYVMDNISPFLLPDK